MPQVPMKTVKTDRRDDVLPLCKMAYRTALHPMREYDLAFFHLAHEHRQPLEIASPLASLPVGDLTMYTKKRNVIGYGRNGIKSRTVGQEDTAITSVTKLCYKDHDRHRYRPNFIEYDTDE